MTWKMSYILIRLIFKSDTVEEQNDKAVSDQYCYFWILCTKRKEFRRGKYFFSIKVKIDNISFLQ